VEDGSFVLKNWPNSYYSGSIRFSPDWQQMYYLEFQRSDDAQYDRLPQIDTYAIDPKTHVATYVSSLELAGAPKSPNHPMGTIAPLSPDGKHLYVLFNNGMSSYYYVLARDPATGSLSMVSQQIEPSLRGAMGTPWSCLDRFAFAGNGKSGYYAIGSELLKNGLLGSFTRDPATGALTIRPAISDIGAQKLVVDPVNGNLFTVGGKIASFKIPVVETAAVAK